MASFRFIVQGGAFYGDIVRFRSSGGEYDFLSRSADEPGDFAPRILHCILCLPAEGMKAGSVAELISEIRKHLLDNFGIYRSGSRMVEVNSLHLFTRFRSLLHYCIPFVVYIVC